MDEEMEAFFKNAFLQKDLDEVYMETSLWFDEILKSNEICRLKKGFG